MYKSFNRLLFITLPLVAFAILQGGCKKKEVYPAQTIPVINSVFPAEAKAGTVVEIKGTNMKDVVMVRFGLKEAPGFNPANNTDTSVAAVVPDSLPLGDTYVQVYYGDGTGYAAYEFKVLETPRVPGIDEIDVATAYPGDEVIIKGINLDVVTGVLFGTVTADFTYSNDKIRATVPDNAAGGDQLITLTSPNGDVTISFNVNLAPVITGINPTFGVVGDTVTVTGVRFVNISSVKLGSLEAGYIVVSETEIKFEVPAGAASGKVTVTGSEGVGVSSGNFTVDNPNFALTVYDEALNSTWEKWGGWGTSEQDMANTEHPNNGSNCIKISWSDAYGGFQLHPMTSPLPGPYSSVKLSIYGGPGSAGAKVVLYIKDSGGTEHTKVELALTEGAYSTYVISFSDLGDPPDISEFNFQNWGTAPLTIYVDDIGFN